MKKNVYYLCSKNGGLLFPSELDENEYILGNWYIEIEEKDEGNPTEILFDALIEKEIETVIIPRKKGTLYQIKIEKYGAFDFRLKRHWERHETYIGKVNSLSKKSKFFEILPSDIGLLEKISRQQDFTFIGKTIK